MPKVGHRLFQFTHDVTDVKVGPRGLINITPPLKVILYSGGARALHRVCAQLVPAELLYWVR